MWLTWMIYIFKSQCVDDIAEGKDDEGMEEMKSSSMVSVGCVSTRVVASECSEGILVETSVATISSSVLFSGNYYFDLELEAFVKKTVSFFDMVVAVDKPEIQECLYKASATIYFNT